MGESQDSSKQIDPELEARLDQDYVSQLFNKINWESRKKPTTRRNPDRWMHPDVYEKSYTYKYLWYKLEPEQIDLSNPFDVDPGNPLRPKLEKKKGRKKKEITQMDMMTEGLKEVKEGEEEKEDEDEGDFIDEYGNIKPVGIRTNRKVHDTESESDKTPVKKSAKAAAVEQKEIPHKTRERTNARAFSHQRNAGTEKPVSSGWNDLDGGAAIEGEHVRKINIFSKETEFFEFPRISNLNYEEQDSFLYLHSRYMKGELHSGQEQRYSNLLELVQEERQEYLRFAREISKDRSSRYNYIAPDLDKYASEHRGFRISRVAVFPREWTKFKDIRLSCARKEQGGMNHYAMKPAETLLELGTIPKATVPKPKNEIQIPKSYQRIVNKYPTDPAIIPGSQGFNRGDARKFRKTGQEPVLPPGLRYTKGKYLHKTCILQDPNARKLAGHCLPDVIISASALKCIMDNFFPTLDRNWEIPVEIQTFDQVVDGKIKNRKTVVYIGKPFLAKQVTAVDKNKIALKNSIKTMMLHDWKEGKHVTDIEKIVPVHDVGDIFGDASRIDDLETFGETMAMIGSVRDTNIEMDGKLREGLIEETNMETDEKLREGSDSEDIGDLIIQTDGGYPESLGSLSGTDEFNSREVEETDDVIELDEELENLLNEDTENPENIKDIFQFIQGFNNGYLDASLGQLDGGLSSESEKEEDLIIDLNLSSSTQEPVAERSTRFKGLKRVPVFNGQANLPEKVKSSLSSVSSTASTTPGSKLKQNEDSSSSSEEEMANEDLLSKKLSIQGNAKEDESSTSSEEEIDEDLIERKMRLIHGDNESPNPLSASKSAKSSGDDSSSSSEEDLDADLVEKKLQLLQGKIEPDVSQTNPKSNNEDEEPSSMKNLEKYKLLKGGPSIPRLSPDLVHQKLNQTQNKGKLEAGKDTPEVLKSESSDSEVEGEDLMLQKMAALQKVNLSSQELFGSGSEGSDKEEEVEEEDQEDIEYVSSKKKVRPISSSGSEEESVITSSGEEILKKKLESLGRGMATVSRVKRKIVAEERLKKLVDKEAEKIDLQNKNRERRASKRKMATDLEKETKKKVPEILKTTDIKITPVETEKPNKVEKLKNVLKLESPMEKTTFKRPVRKAKPDKSTLPVEDSISNPSSPNKIGSAPISTIPTPTSPIPYSPTPTSPSPYSPVQTSSGPYSPPLPTLGPPILASSHLLEPSTVSSAKSKQKKTENMWKVAEADVVTPVVNEKNDNSFQDMLEKMKNVQKKRKEIEDKEKPSFTNKQKFNSGKSGLDSSQGVGSTAGFLDNLMSGQSKLLIKEMEERRENLKMEYNGEMLNNILPGLGRIEEYLPPPPGENVSYRIWNLWCKENPASNLRMIVRSKVAGFSPEFGCIVPSVKLEYQSKLGAEVCSVSHYAREWIDNIIRPQATTIRTRINPETGDVLMIQPLSLKQLTEEGRLEQVGEDGRVEKFDPALQLGNLHNIVSELRSQPAGNYILSHDAKSGAFCRLLKPAQGGEYKIGSVYEGLKGEDTAPVSGDPWIPVDINLVTPWHLTHKRVPGTFEPCGKKPEPKHVGYGRGKRNRGRGRGWSSDRGGGNDDRKGGGGRGGRGGGGGRGRGGNQKRGNRN